MQISQETQNLSWAFLRLEKNIREEQSNNFDDLKHDLINQFTAIVETEEYIEAECIIEDVQPLIDRIAALTLEDDIEVLYVIHYDTAVLADDKGIERKEGWIMNGGGGKSPATEPNA